MSKQVPHRMIFLLIVFMNFFAHGELQAKTWMLPGPISIESRANLMTASSLKLMVQQQAEEMSIQNPDGNADLLGVTGCAEIIEVPGAYLCFPMYRSQMNLAFSRIGIYWGTVSGFSAGTLIEHENHYLNTLNKITVGHNLPGNVIEDFFNVLNQNSSSSLSANRFESEFRDGFVKSPQISSLQSKYYVIAVSAQASQDYHPTVSHEIHHARYYLQPELRALVNEFWRFEVTPDDQISIKQKLGAIYNIQDEQVIIDEFQAYILESGADSGPLTKFAKLYRAKLLSLLKNRIAYLPIEVDR